MIKYFTIEDLLKHYLQKKFHILIGEFSLTIRHVPNKETNTNQPFHSWVNGTREWNAAVNTAFPVTSSEDETNYKTFSIGSLYIYEDYENTLSCLEKYGYKI